MNRIFSTPQVYAICGPRICRHNSAVLFLVHEDAVVDCLSWSQFVLCILLRPITCKHYFISKSDVCNLFILNKYITLVILYIFKQLFSKATLFQLKWFKNIQISPISIWMFRLFKKRLLKASPYSFNLKTTSIHLSTRGQQTTTYNLINIFTISIRAYMLL